MVTSIKETSQKQEKYEHGKHPNSRKNLIPYKPGENGVRPGQGYSVTSEVKQLLRKEHTRKEIAQTMIDESKDGNVPMLKELLDRTEGKVPGDQPLAQNVNVVFIIGKGYKDIPQLEEEDG